jgi:hypothetical protein
MKGRVFFDGTLLRFDVRPIGRFQGWRLMIPDELKALLTSVEDLDPNYDNVEVYINCLLPTPG